MHVQLGGSDDKADARLLSLHGCVKGEVRVA